MNTDLLAAVDVGSAPQDIPSAPVGPTIDAAARARCAEVVRWRIGDFLDQLNTQPGPYTACMATIAVEQLVPFMDGSAAEELLTALARRVVANRRSRKESRPE